MMITSHDFGGCMKAEGKHWGRLTITGEALLVLLTKGIHIYEVTEREIPYDTEFVSFAIDSSRNEITLILSHPSFPEVKEGQMIWELSPPSITYGEGILLKHLKENWFKFVMAQAIEEETNQ